MTPTSRPARSLKKRLRFVLIAVVGVSVVLVIAIPMLLGVGFMTFLTAPGCGGETSPDEQMLAYEPVSFPSAEFGLETPAYWFPARGEARDIVIIVLPTGDRGRGDRMAEIAVYVRSGFPVLSYSSRTCVGGVGSSMGYLEAAQVGDALAYLRARGDIDMTRIGLHGFSAGGAAALMAGAQFPEVAGVVAEGNYDNFDGMLAENSTALGALGKLYRLGAALAYQSNTGVPIAALAPDAAAGQIAPRPVLLVYGTNEPALPGARTMAAVNAHVTLWEVPGATHGSYIQTAGEAAYAERVIGWWEIQSRVFDAKT